MWYVPARHPALVRMQRWLGLTLVVVAEPVRAYVRAATAGRGGTVTTANRSDRLSNYKQKFLVSVVDPPKF